MTLLNLSMAAALLGHEERANKLLVLADGLSDRLLVRLAEDRAWRLFNRGILELYRLGHRAAAPLFSMARPTGRIAATRKMTFHSMAR